jgi:VanZ family protein
VNALLDTVLFPPRWMRLLALLALATVAANLFWHGAQPYAVNAIRAPWDKLVHAVLFGGFGGATWVALGGRRRTADTLAPLAALAIGVADEVAQSWHPGRVVGLDDLAADAIGAVLVVGVLVALRVSRSGVRVVGR